MRNSIIVLAVTIVVAASVFSLINPYMISQTITITETNMLTEYTTLTEKQIVTFYSTLTETFTTTLQPITKTSTTTLPPVTITTKVTETLTTPTTTTLRTIETTTVQVTSTETTTETMVETTTLQTTITKTLQNISLRDPSWQELIEFLKEDGTDTYIYRAGEFDCTGFAITLRDHAIARGFRCAYVEVEFSDGGAHALNAFQTSDKGLVFVDVTSSKDRSYTSYDKVAYLKIGEYYETISLAAVKWRYIDTSLYKADEFWKPLTYITHLENSTYPLTSNYYLEYQARIRFLSDTIKAYNAAVAEYNSGNTRYSYTQLKDWLSNINTLKAELGIRWLPMGIVKNMEIYWVTE